MNSPIFREGEANVWMQAASQELVALPSSHE